MRQEPEKSKRRRRRKPPTRKQRDPATLAFATNLTVGDIEMLTGMSHNRVYDEINSGRLLSYKLGRRRFATRRALDAWLARLEADAAHA